MVFRIYSEKKKEYGEAASALASELRTFLGIRELHDVRIVNRYDVEGISEELFKLCAVTVFSEPQVDNVYYELPEAGEDTKTQRSSSLQSNICPASSIKGRTPLRSA